MLSDDDHSYLSESAGLAVAALVDVSHFGESDAAVDGAILTGIYIENLIPRLRIKEWIERYVLRKKNKKNESS